jgi:hypothetical protein
MKNSYLIVLNDLTLLRFGDRFIRQVMFGEETIPRKADAYEQLTEVDAYAKNHGK